MMHNHQHPLADRQQAIMQAQAAEQVDVRVLVTVDVHRQRHLVLVEREALRGVRGVGEVADVADVLLGRQSGRTRGVVLLRGNAREAYLEERRPCFCHHPIPCAIASQPDLNMYIYRI